MQLKDLMVLRNNVKVQNKVIVNVFIIPNRQHGAVLTSEAESLIECRGCAMDGIAANNKFLIKKRTNGLQ